MEHGKFQLALAQALMGRPLLEDFGMPLSQGRGSIHYSSAVTDVSRDMEVSGHPVPAETTPYLDAEVDMILLQESVNAQIRSTDGDAENIVRQPLPPVPSDAGRVENSVDGNNASPHADIPGPAPRRRRRPNHCPQPGGGPPLPLNSLQHYSKKGKMRQVCRECKRQTTWICPGCRCISLCPDKCFRRFHGQIKM
jgi:hypothetical protein